MQSSRPGNQNVRTLLAFPLRTMRLALPLLALAALPACDQNPYDASQKPVLAVSMAATPVFSWTPAGARYLRVYAGTSRQDGFAPVVWDVSARTGTPNALLGPITYGIVPASGLESVAAQPLVTGRSYVVEVYRDDPKGTGDGFTNTSNTYRDTVVFVAR